MLEADLIPLKALPTSIKLEEVVLSWVTDQLCHAQKAGTTTVMFLPQGSHVSTNHATSDWYFLYRSRKEERLSLPEQELKSKRKNRGQILQSI